MWRHLRKFVAVYKSRRSWFFHQFKNWSLFYHVSRLLAITDWIMLILETTNTISKQLELLSSIKTVRKLNTLNGVCVSIPCFWICTLRSQIESNNPSKADNHKNFITRSIASECVHRNNFERTNKKFWSLWNCKFP